jgi:threonine aldolase
VNFESDYIGGACPEIMAALLAANEEESPSYGDDATTQALQGKFAEIFETEVRVFPVISGTAANALAISTFVPPYGSVYCHAQCHLTRHEAGAPEFFTGGAKLALVDGPDGKIAAAALESALAASGQGDVHCVQPAALSLSQLTEAGTVYTVDEVAALAALARDCGLTVHMDGARFANAVVRLGCTPADVTWRAGIDMLSFGATKNGALGADAVVFFKPELADTFELRRKRGGHLIAKMRFVSVQLDAYLEGGLWLHNARHANAMAERLVAGLGSIDGVSFAHPTHGSQVFAAVPEALATGLEAEGFRFHRWAGGPDAVIRLVLAHDTPVEKVDALIAAARGLAGRLAQEP